MRSRIMGIIIAGLLVCSSSLAHALSLNLAWQYTQGTPPATGFYVYRQSVACPTSGTPSFPRVTATPLPVTQLTYSDLAVQVGTTYCYYVTAVTAQGMESVPSNTAGIFLSIPAAPTGVQISPSP